MKNIFKTMAVTVLMLSAVAAFAQKAGSYKILNGKVYYNNVILHDANPQTIQDLGYGYAKDDEHVWYEGKLLPLVDPHRFALINEVPPAGTVPPPPPPPQSQPSAKEQVLSGLLTAIFGNGATQPAPGHNPEHGTDHNMPPQERGYEVIENKVYFNSVLISNAYAHSFKDLGWGYAKDSARVYYNGKKLTDNPSRFKALTDGYAMDSFDVYYFGKEIDASTSGFKVLTDGYAKDAFDAYYCGKKVVGSSASTFKVTGNGYAKDAWETYYLGKKVK